MGHDIKFRRNDDRMYAHCSKCRQMISTEVQKRLSERGGYIYYDGAARVSLMRAMSAKACEPAAKKTTVKA